MSNQGQRYKGKWRAALPLLIVTASVFAGCGLHGLHMPQSPLLKLFVSDSGHIAYVGNDGNLYIATQSGSITQLTTDAQGTTGPHVTYVSPTWSPDGTRLAYARYEANPKNGTSTVRFEIMNRSTKRRIVAFTSATLKPFYYDWSPQGSRIAVLSDAGGSLQFGIVRADRADSYEKLASGSPFYWAWSADGRQLISHSDFSATSGGRVSIIPVDNPSTASVVQGSFGPFQAPAVLPNGRIVVVQREGSTAQLATFDPANRRLIDFAPKGSSGFLFSASPNGKFIGYLERETDGGKARSVLNVWNLAGNRRVRSLKNLSTIAYYWSPDSTKIAFYVPGGSRKIENSYAQIPSLPHVTLEVLDVRSGRSWEIATFPLTQSLLSTLPYSDQYQHSQTIWSPNSRYLLFTAYTNQGVPGVFVADADGNIKPSKIADGDSAVWSWK